MREGNRLRLVFVIVGSVLAAVMLAGVGYGLWAWNSIDRQEYNPEEAREALSTYVPAEGEVVEDTLPEVLDDISPPPPDVTVPVVGGEWDPGVLVGPENESTTTTTAAPPTTRAVTAPSSVKAYLVVGSDGGPSFGRADVIFLAVKPPDAGLILVSVPRSLYVNNPCTGKPARLAVMFSGCPGVASGATLVALALEDFTGLRIDGFAAIGYDGFVEIVDAVGGLELCVDYARGINGQVYVPEGCNWVNGTAARFYVAIRYQDELVDGKWRAVEGDGDSARRQRQIEVIRKLYNRLGSFSSVGALTSLGSSLSHTFVLSSGLGISEAASIAWGVRGSGLSIISIPGQVAITTDGKYVINPTEAFKETLAKVYGPAAGW